MFVTISSEQKEVVIHKLYPNVYIATTTLKVLISNKTIIINTLCNKFCLGLKIGVQMISTGYYLFQNLTTNITCKI